MPLNLTIEFAALNETPGDTVVLCAAHKLKLGRVAAQMDKKLGGQIKAAAKVADFRGQAKQHIELLAPDGMPGARLLVSGLGKVEELSDTDWAHVGGRIASAASGAKAETATVIFDVEVDDPAAAAAEIAMGALLRHYKFDKYKTKQGDKDEEKAASKQKLVSLSILVSDPDAALAQFVERKAIADGVALARDLVNEPANVLGPVEFAAHCEALSELGVEVEILDVEALQELGMRTLLAVAQGSERPARVAVMQWNGAKSKRTKPVCFIGKGVVFDTGGISIKPAGGMEDMKGDMGGAAAVTGLMAALAGRKAQVNAVGIVGLVENMASANAQRPGDIVTSMSGQTVEVINTDAEGRLVLCDLLWYAEERFNPRFMINLATLTGAILVALGKEYAGLFSNDDKLAGDLFDAGMMVEEKVWRMPLAPAYDKMINTPNADMKNIGGRLAGSITAAQFLQRFVRDTPWAHLDVAGVAMGSNKTDISQTWASGWGVRLLDALVAKKYEK